MSLVPPKGACVGDSVIMVGKAPEQTPVLLWGLQGRGACVWAPVQLQGSFVNRGRGMGGHLVAHLEVR